LRYIIILTEQIFYDLIPSRQITSVAVDIKFCVLQIPVVANLPVGENLQDHVYPFGIEYTIKEKIAITDEQAKSLWSLLDYLIFGLG